MSSVERRAPGNGGLQVMKPHIRQALAAKGALGRPVPVRFSLAKPAVHVQPVQVPQVLVKEK